LSKILQGEYIYEELFGIDLNPQEIKGVIYLQANLALEPIPFPNDYFDCASAFYFIVETPIPKAQRSGIGKLNNPAKRRV